MGGGIAVALHASAPCVLCPSNPPPHCERVVLLTQWRLGDSGEGAAARVRVGKAPCQDRCEDGGFQAGGGPFLFVPLWFPPSRQSCLCLVHTLLWSGCGLGRLISSSSCFLPSPRLLPLLEAWAAPCPFTYSLLRDWETSALVLGRGLQPPWASEVLSTAP